MNCAIYPRKSKAVDNSDSMETQISMCIQYLDNKYGKNCYTVKIYDGDYGITGHTTKNRKDFQRMMQDVKANRINLVLVQRYDRLARNTRDFCNIYHEMEQAGCELVSVSQQIDTTTPYGKNFMYMQASMAELEWALCSERRKDAIKYAISVGKYTLSSQSIPLGYKAERVDGKRILVIDREKEESVRDLFEYYCQTRNYVGTAKHINEKYGYSISNLTVKKLVKNTLFIGSFHGNDNFCEPYFTQEEWGRIQAHKPVIRNDVSKKTEILFSGMCICPVCKRKMRACNKTCRSGNTHRYYHCEYHTTKQCANKKVKSELKIEQMILESIEYYLDEFSVDAKNLANAKKNFKNVKKIEEELERLNTMFLKGRISEEKYDAEYSRLNTELLKNSANSDAEKRIDNLQLTFSGDWKEVYYSLDKLNKKLFWREIIKEIHFDEEMNVTGIVFL